MRKIRVVNSHLTTRANNARQVAGYDRAHVGAGHAREPLYRGYEKLLMELLAIRLSEQKKLAKSLVMSGHPHSPLLQKCTFDLESE